MAYTTELCGIFKGMCLAWSKRYRRVIVESDSKSTVNLLALEGTGGENNLLLCKINQLREKEWKVCFCHTLREGYNYADWVQIKSFEIDYRV